MVLPLVTEGLLSSRPAVCPLAIRDSVKLVANHSPQQDAKERTYEPGRAGSRSQLPAAWLWIRFPASRCISFPRLKWLSSLSELAPQRAGQGDSKKPALGHDCTVPLGQSWSES